MEEIGPWLGKYDESIYETRGGPFPPGSCGVSTHRDRSIYVHVLQWPGDTLALPAIPARIVGASVLGGGEAVFRQTEEAIEVSVSPASRSEVDTVIKLELAQPANATMPTVNLK